MDINHIPPTDNSTNLIISIGTDGTKIGSQSGSLHIEVAKLKKL
jgi:hypothetical protein